MFLRARAKPGTVKGLVIILKLNVWYIDTFWYFQLMLDSWNHSIFSNIKQRLQDSAMKLLHAERNGEAFDSQLVIGVRESYGMFYMWLFVSKGHNSY